MRYTTIQAGNKVIVLSRYAKKTIRGVAKCNPMDTFDYSTGEKIAKARCDAKIANLRYQNAKNCLKKAKEATKKAAAHEAKMLSYAQDAVAEMIALGFKVDPLE